MIGLISIIRPLSNWHFILAVCLLDLALISYHLANQNSPLDQEKVIRVHSQLGSEEELSRKLVQQVRALEKAREASRHELELLEEGVGLLESRLGRLDKFLHNQTDVLS